MLNLSDFILEDSSLILIISACRTEFRVGWLTYFSELVQGSPGQKLGLDGSPLILSAGLTWPELGIGWVI